MSVPAAIVNYCPKEGELGTTRLARHVAVVLLLVPGPATEPDDALDEVLAVS